MSDNTMKDKALELVLTSVKKDLSTCPITEAERDLAFENVKSVLSVTYDALDKVLPSEVPAPRSGLAAMTLLGKQFQWVSDSLREAVQAEVLGHGTAF